MNNDYVSGSGKQIIDIDINSVKNEKLRDLESLCCDELIEKVKNLSGIVDSIEQNWRGSKSEKYRKEISDIIDAINDFKTKCLEPNISDITAQVETYERNEEEG